jgi:hypothetical protein
MRTQDGFYVIFCRMFSFYKKHPPKFLLRKFLPKNFSMEDIFLFSRIYFFIGSLSLILKEPFWDLFGTFLGTF